VLSSFIKEVSSILLQRDSVSELPCNVFPEGHFSTTATPATYVPVVKKDLKSELPLEFSDKW
jgi:hypothetical protein